MAAGVVGADIHLYLSELNKSSSAGNQPSEIIKFSRIISWPDGAQADVASGISRVLLVTSAFAYALQTLFFRTIGADDIRLNEIKDGYHVRGTNFANGGPGKLNQMMG